MELVLWRHADAEDGVADLKRELTDKGRRQAGKVARWLGPRLDGPWLILSSPAARATQTAEALDRDYEVRPALRPGAGEEALLREADWPGGGRNVVIVGHQPTLGRVAAWMLTGHAVDFPVKKGALWWFTARHEGGPGPGETLLKAVIGPDLAG